MLITKISMFFYIEVSAIFLKACNAGFRLGELHIQQGEVFYGDENDQLRSSQSAATRLY